MSREPHERKHRRTWRHPECVAFMAGADFNRVPTLSEALGLEETINVRCRNCGWIGSKGRCHTYRGIGGHCPQCLPRGYVVMVDSYPATVVCENCTAEVPVADARLTKLDDGAGNTDERWHCPACCLAMELEATS